MAAQNQRGKPRRSDKKTAGRTGPSGAAEGAKRFDAGRRDSKRGAGRPAPPDRLYLYGIHTVRAALSNPRRQSISLYATQSGLERLGDVPVGIRVETADTPSLGRMVGNEAVHQGVVLECKPLDALDASELFVLADARLLLALDQVTDPHNVGAILRSAVAMGVDAVLMTSRNSATETGVLAKSASGALDMVRVVELRNMSKGLAELADMGIATIGLDSEGPLVLEKTLAGVTGGKICLVLGAEGRGLREKTRETCTALARLDMPGPIRSLNVSNAAALSLYLAAGRVGLLD